MKMRWDFRLDIMEVIQLMSVEESISLRQLSKRKTAGSKFQFLISKNWAKDSTVSRILIQPYNQQIIMKAWDGRLHALEGDRFMRCGAI